MAPSKMMNGDERVSYAQDAIGSIANKAREQGERLMNQAAEKAQCLSSQVCDSASEAKSMVAEKMSTLADTLREKAPNQGKFGAAASAVADRIESSGEYINDRDFSQMAGDVTSVVKRYPLQSLAAGVGLGFILGSVLASSRK